MSGHKDRKSGRRYKGPGERGDDADPGWLARCMKDPECRARLARTAVWLSMAYTAAGFVLILLLLGGYIGIG